METKDAALDNEIFGRSAELTVHGEVTGRGVELIIHDEVFGRGGRDPAPAHRWSNWQGAAQRLDKDVYKAFCARMSYLQSVEGFAKIEVWPKQKRMRNKKIGGPWSYGKPETPKIIAANTPFIAAFWMSLTGVPFWREAYGVNARVQIPPYLGETGVDLQPSGWYARLLRRVYDLYQQLWWRLRPGRWWRWES